MFEKLEEMLYNASFNDGEHDNLILADEAITIVKTYIEELEKELEQWKRDAIEATAKLGEILIERNYQ